MLNSRKLRGVDLYCGAGGTTTGAVSSGHVEVVLAVNHWQPAIATHGNNHPETIHVCAPIEHVDPRDYAKLGIDIIFASPECTHHSIARGGRPVEDQKRAGGWDVVKWVEVLRPAYLVVENVKEWLNWGPVGRDGKPLKSRKGETFKAWVAAMESLNYRVEWKLLNAADYGEATHRVRLFLICRKGRRAIPWPKPTHKKANWRPAAEIIDWHLPCPSIFDRKRPLAEKTLRRIEIGLKKFCDPKHVEPFLVKLRGTNNAQSLNKPVPTVTAGGNHEAMAMPFQYQLIGRGAGRSKPITDPVPTVIANRNTNGVVVPFLLKSGGPGAGRDGDERISDVDGPLGTILARNHDAVVAPFFLPREGFHAKDALKRSRAVTEPLPTIIASACPGRVVMPFIVPNFGEREGQEPRTHSVDQPLGAVTTKRGKAVVAPFLTKFYGTATARPVDEPLDTVTTKDRHALTEAVIGVAADGPQLQPQSEAMRSLLATMRACNVVDIGFRMLAIDELARAQGFPEAYKLVGNKTERTRMIGNAVCPGVARAIANAIADAHSGKTNPVTRPRQAELWKN